MNILKQQIPDSTFKDFINHLEQHYETNFKFYKNNLINKFNSVNSVNNIKNQVELNKKWLVNLCDTVIPPEVQNILQLGPKFNLPSTDQQTIINSTICSVEAAIHNFSEEHQTNTRNSIVNILSNYKHDSTKIPATERHLLNNLRITKQYLKNNPDLRVVSADKGNVTVLLSTIEYNKKMTDLLEDKNTYKHMNKDKTASTQDNSNRLISSWERLGFITNFVAKSLRQYNSTPAKLYGLVKIHKPNNPIRPIVSSSPTYKMSKFFTKILSNVVGKTSSFVKDSFDLKSQLKDLIIPDDFRLFSLDVTSLFTNIPNQLISEIVDKKWNEIQQHTKLNLVTFKVGLNFVINNCFFTFNNNHYHQISGSPMGSPVSPVVANLVMEHLEETVLSNLTFKPLLYLRYVDDIFCIAKKTDIETIHNNFNSFHKKLQFTIELETNNSIPFLDLNIARNNDGRLVTDWYHKNTWSGRYLNYNSYLPLTYKINTITILTKRILQLFDEKFHETNFEILKKTLINNNYPQQLVNRIIKSEQEKHFQPLATNQSTSELSTNKFVFVPYDQRTYHSLKRLFKLHNIQVVAKPSNTLYKHTFSKLKDKTDKQIQSNLIYGVPCTNKTILKETNVQSSISYKYKRSKT
jgi:hypothetical protein